MDLLTELSLGAEETEFWEFLAFFVNSIVFLLIGDQIRFMRLVENLGTTGITIGAVVLARVIAVYGLGGSEQSNY